MSQHEVVCLVINHNAARQKQLEIALRTGECPLRIQVLSNLSQLKQALQERAERAAILFCPLDRAGESEIKLVGLLHRLAPDCVLANLSPHEWKGLAASRSGEVDTCTLATAQPEALKQQLDYLLAYVRQKARFRQCKHLLSIAELRSQWLVDYAREAVAYIAGGKHLHANIAYLSLFGFSHEGEVQVCKVLDLVAGDQQNIFATMSREAEYSAVPSNKLLVTLRTRQNKPFRAEIRFIPSVLRGRRCVQLHVHPLLRHDDMPPGEAVRRPSEDPWQQPAKKIQQQASATKTQTAQPEQPIRRMYANFQELLNLRGSAQPALWASRPYMQYTQTVQLDYTQLLANAYDARNRSQLDRWSIHTALKKLAEHKSTPLKQHILVDMGEWVFTKPAALKALLELLQQEPTYIFDLILVIDIQCCLRHRQLLLKVLSLLQQTGVQLALDNIRDFDAELENLLERFNIKLIRTHSDYAHHLKGKNIIPEGLQQLLQKAHKEKINVIVSGLEDVNTLNLMCETTATYLQGPVLSELSR